MDCTGRARQDRIKGIITCLSQTAPTEHLQKSQPYKNRSKGQELILH